MGFIREEDELYELPEGWKKLYEQMCEDLNNLPEKFRPDENFYFVQVKEKWGEMRCYPNLSNQEIDRIIDKYCYMSRFVCLGCGCPAHYKVKNDLQLCEGCIGKLRYNGPVLTLKSYPKYKATRFYKDERWVTEVISVQNEWERYLKRLCRNV